MVLNLYWPAVSQIWSLMVFPPVSNVLILKSTPMVGRKLVLTNYVPFAEDVIGKSEEETGLTDGGVSNEEKLEKIVVILVHFFLKFKILNIIKFFQNTGIYKNSFGNTLL